MITVALNFKTIIIYVSFDCEEDHKISKMVEVIFKVKICES